MSANGNPLPISRDERLRVLIVDERSDRIACLAQLTSELGHDVIAREVGAGEICSVAVRERPDIAVVGLGVSTQQTLRMISEIVRGSICPVIAVRQVDDAECVREAAKRGVFAYVLHKDPKGMQSAIDIAVARFAEYQNLQGAFARRAAIEQAKGILMARHNITADEAFEMLRLRSLASGRKLTDLAQAVVDSHLLLLPDFAERLGKSRQRVTVRAAPAQSA